MWTNAMRAYDPKTGLYKDQAVGARRRSKWTASQRRSSGRGARTAGSTCCGRTLARWWRTPPLYAGPPTHPPEKLDPHTLALPGPIGGLQSGCATDGKTIFTNGIDAIRLGTQASPLESGKPPTGGRVTATSVDLKTERWRHERPTIPEMGGMPGKPMYKDVGDIVGSGIAVGNGVAYFTTVGSGKLIALDAASGKVLKEIPLGPVFAGPALSRGRVYVGGGNTLWNAAEFESYFPKQYTGSVRCFGLPDGDEATRRACCPAGLPSVSISGCSLRLPTRPGRPNSVASFPMPLRPRGSRSDGFCATLRSGFRPTGSHSSQGSQRSTIGPGRCGSGTRQISHTRLWSPRLIRRRGGGGFSPRRPGISPGGGR